VGTLPLFRLANIPVTTSLWKIVGTDSFGLLACNSSAPKECQYNWRTPPPDVPQVIIARYGSVSTEDASMAIHHLLGISETLLAPEATCVHFFQQMIRRAMELLHIGRSVRYLEKVPNRDEIPNRLLTLGRTIAGLSCQPFLYGNSGHAHISAKDEDGFTWLRPDLCLLITTHLDDQRNLQAAVADLVKVVQERHTNGVVYGIGFSFFHCIIVRIDVDDQASFKHTPALQFLPSFHADSLSTPGIAALVRLGYHLLEPLNFLGIPRSKLSNGHLLNDMPLELWSQVAQHLTSMDDCIALGSVSPRSWAAANNVLKHPHIDGGRIVSLRSDLPLNKPAVFEIVLDEMSGPYVMLGRDRTVRTLGPRIIDESIVKKGEICFQCEWEDSVCACTSQCTCPEGYPWVMPYVYHSGTT
jgi:hypothetical protein